MHIHQIEDYAQCLFISYVKPYGPVSKDSISRWLKSVMILAGVDCSVYKPQSIRSAAVSKAKSIMVPIDDILKTAGWSSERTFAKFYDKKIDSTSA